MKYKRQFFLLVTLIFSHLAPNHLMGEEIDKPLRILHLTFHKGCESEIKAVCNHFGFELETWFIPHLPPRFFDGVSSGAALYNIGHKRALDIWNLHKETFETFDVVITSDTAPLARVFLQNGFAKPLIIWVCNRFDYCDHAALDCDFPDREFYQLFKGALQKENVTIIAYTAFEQAYALKKGVNLGDLIITPCGFLKDSPSDSSSINLIGMKEETFFLPPYHNETIYQNLTKICQELGIPAYCGRYNGPKDLKDFKGIIHFPYGWSNLALFENMALGMPYFLPSAKFLLKLVKEQNYWHQDTALLNRQTVTLSEWYQPDRQEIFTYFDSWNDLKQKIQEVNYPLTREKTKVYAKKLQTTMLERWKTVFNKIREEKVN
jgi:hypothetical protein